MAEMNFYYARDFGDQEELDVGRILEQIRVYPQSSHHVWQEGMADWAEVHEVPAIASQLEEEEEAWEPDPDDGFPYRHSIDGKFQEAALAQEIAARVLAAPEASHLVWQIGFKWWPHAQEIPEIAEFGPLPPVSGVDSATLFQMKFKGKQYNDLTAERIAEMVREAPEEEFSVWRHGMSIWLPPREVEAIVAHGLPAGEAVDLAVWCLSIGDRNRSNLTASEVAAIIRESSEPRLKVWRLGLESWDSPWAVDEIVAQGIGDPPKETVEGNWHYRHGERNASNLSPEQVIEAVRENPTGEHQVWQLGMSRWISPFDHPEFSALLPQLGEAADSRPLLYCRGGTQFKTLSAEEIVAEIQNHPEADHKVWPHMTERWFHPWEVDELIALGVEAPEQQAEEIWHHRQDEINHQNWTARQIVLAIMKNPDADHQVWQFGWQAWEDPRDIPAIASMLPREQD